MIYSYNFVCKIKPTILIDKNKWKNNQIKLRMNLYGKQ